MIQNTTKKELIYAFFDNKQNYKRLRFISRRIMKDSILAEDALHDIYIHLMEDAEKIDFPAEIGKAMRYVSQALCNKRLREIYNAKHRPKVLEEEKGLNVPVDETPGTIELLEKVNALIQSDSEGFTEEQLMMWQCMYDRCNMKEMEERMKNRRGNIYKLRSLLLDKLNSRYKRDDIS